MYGLAHDGQAPALLKRTTKGGLPYAAIALTISFGALAFMNVSSSGGTVFQYLYTARDLRCDGENLRTDPRALADISNHLYPGLVDYSGDLPTLSCRMLSPRD